MPNIDDLNFRVLIDDKDFDKKIQKDIQAAKDLHISVARLLELRTKESAAATKNVEAAERQARALMKTAGEQQRLNVLKEKAAQEQLRTNELEKAQTKEIENQSRAMSQLKSYAAQFVSVYSAARFVSAITRITGEFEVQRMALRAMIGDAQAADGIFEQFKQLAINSPYTFRELTTFAKQLTAFSIPKDELVDTTKMLADVAAGLGVSMDRIILAYGQVRAATYLRGQELRQFTEAGIPILELLANKLSEVNGRAITTGEVFEMVSKRMVSFEMVKDAFIEMTSEGGKFFNMQEVLADTLTGKINKLKDAWEIMLNDIGSANRGVLAGALDTAMSLVRNYEETGRTITALAATYGIYRAAILATELVTNTFTLANHKLIASLSGIKTSLSKNPYALIAAGLVSVGYLVYKTATAENDFEKALKRLGQTTETFTDAAANEINRLKDLRAQLDSTEKGSSEWLATKSQIVSQYGKYLNGLDDEITRVGNLSSTYDALTTSIRESANARAYTEFEESERRVRSTAQSSALAQIQSALIKRYGTERGYDFFRIIRDADHSSTDSFSQIATAFREMDSTMFDSRGLLGSFWKDEIVSRLYTISMASSAYEYAIRRAVERFGLKGTELDPDFVGPILKSTTPAKTLTANYDELDTTKDTIAALKKEVDVVKELRKEYDALRETEGDEGAMAVLKTLYAHRFAEYPNLESGDFTGRLVELAKALKGLDPDSANAIYDLLAGEKVSNMSKSAKAVEKWQKTLEKWQKDWGTNGLRGFDSDLDDILTGYNNEDKKITDEYTEALKEIADAYGEESEEAKEAKAALDALASARRAANLDSAQERVDEAVSKYVKDATSGMSLKDWGDKSIGQVYQIWRSLSDLANGSVAVDAELSARLANVGISITDLAKLSKQKFKEMSDEAKQELLKKLGSTLKEVAGDLVGLIGEFKELAEASGDTALANHLESLSDFANTISNTLSRLAKEDIVGGTIALLTGVARQILASRIEAEKFRRAIEDAKESARDAAFQKSLSQDTIFGADNLVKVRKGVEGMADAMERYRKAAEANKGGVDIIAGLLRGQGLNAFDENGFLDRDSLKVFEEQGIIASTAKEIVAALDDYYEAMEQIRDVMESLVGGIADSAADKIVDSWVEAGDAALDYADILDDVAKAYAKMLVRSQLMSYLPDEEELTQMFRTGQADEVMRLLAEGLQAISEVDFNALLAPLEPYLNGGESSESGTLSNGIKGITEDTANLLASYLNAVRADVAAIRAEQFGYFSWARGQMPTLNDYLTQIQTNTANSAARTEEILSELRSVIGGVGGGGNTSVKVELIA